MSKIISLLLATCISLCCLAQNFEGKVVYANTYKSKTAGMTDDQLTNMMGSVQEYYLQHGNYKTVANGKFFQWQLYDNKENKLYTKMSNSETVLWNDAAENKDEVIKTVLNKNAAEILGYKCDELILTCKSGIQKYYFNSKFAIDKNLFASHKFGNWYDFLLQSNSLPLKSVVENAQFTLESVATDLKEMKLDKSLFDLPANVQTAKSSF